MQQKIKAFTLQELLVVMVLSSILLSTLYIGLQMTQQYFIRFSRSGESIEQLQLLQRIMSKDIEQSEWMLSRNHELILIRQDKNVVYTLGDEIVREQNGVLTDRLPFSAQNARFSFQDKETYSREQSIADVCNFTISYQGEVLTYSFAKQYAAAQQIIISRKANNITSLWQD